MSEKLPELSELIARFIDDRDSLSDDEYARFETLLKQQPAQLERLKEHLLLDEYLGQALAVDRGNFAAQVEQRIRDLDRPSDLRVQVRDMRELAASEWDQWREQTLRGKSNRHWLVAALAMLLLASVTAAIVTRPWWGPVVTVDQVAGNVLVLRDGLEIPVSPSAALYRGDGLATSPTGFVRLRYSDGTELEVRGSTQIKLGKPARRKTVTILHGLVSATVSQQPSERAMIFYTPLANATVLGTELFLFVRQASTRLDVTRGLVQFGRSQDDPLDVRANEYCVATRDQLVRRKLQWPSSREGLVLLADPGDDEKSPQWRVFDLALNERQRPLQARGEVRVSSGRFLFREGAYVATTDTSEALLQRCLASQQVSLEAMVTPAKLTGDDTRRIISYSGSGSSNFALLQRGRQLVFLLNTTLGVREVELTRFADLRRRHVVVSFRPGRLACYVDGRLVYAAELKGDLGTWSENYLVLGDEWDGQPQTRWSGELTGVAIYGRFLDEVEAHRNYRAFLSLARSRRSDP